ncbi:FAD-dependent oxidoreductase [Methylocella sp.]|uniref:FAD-dependent oxidoreductase n=1 Tax=Methylocella sp. TaxID=1978226 RepID=UPI0035B43112
MGAATFDVFIYGSHPGAIVAACAAAQRGAKVGIGHHASHIGAPFSAGLGVTDLGRYGSKMLGSWIPNSFFTRVTAASGGSRNLTRQVPWLSEVVFGEMLRFYGVTPFFGPTYRAVSVAKTGQTTNSVTFASGDVISFTVGIDGTDEQDLLALAGCTLATGRESAAQYGENLAGFYPVWDTFTPADCYDGLGNLINGYSAYPDGASPGDADDTMQVGGWRLALTRRPDNVKLVAQPSNYDPSLFEYLRRGAPLGDPNWRPYGVSWTNFGKGDMNDDTGFDYIKGWGAGDVAARSAIFMKMYAEKAGWLWFLQNDASVNPTTQAYCRALSLCRDEHLDGTASSSIYGVTQTGWPYHIYLRDSRRLVGQYVMKQDDLQVNTTKADTLSVGAYSIDNHTHRLLAVTKAGVAGYIRDGLGANPDTSVRQVVPGYQIPARAARPLNSESVNLLTITPSASAVAMSSLRIDFWRMAFGAAVGRWAAKAVMEATALDSISIPALQTELTGLGHVISYTP